MINAFYGNYFFSKQADLHNSVHRLIVKLNISDNVSGCCLNIGHCHYSRFVYCTVTSEKKTYISHVPMPWDTC